MWDRNGRCMLSLEKRRDHHTAGNIWVNECGVAGYRGKAGQEDEDEEAEAEAEVEVVVRSRWMWRTPAT